MAVMCLLWTGCFTQNHKPFNVQKVRWLVEYYVQLEINAFIWRRRHYLCWLQKLYLWSAHKAFELIKTFIVPCLLWHGASSIIRGIMYDLHFQIKSTCTTSKWYWEPILIRTQTGLSIRVIARYGKRSTSKTIIAYSQQQHPGPTTINWEYFQLI